ncbi:hypothetical protein N7532_007555 [Penicillium argentinense]|uniref:Uncharacterized protein n=1 Tax=Penicillium argentinense TaxID=1131581 RepID=A0A9W9K6U5_9EURO|nr:uncharacterized protein N7532_007555 [Penicillium argentinense]KAJ5095264.1 hypothetical protein N7532_007555 [Penicillium argentinense]
MDVLIMPILILGVEQVGHAVAFVKNIVRAIFSIQLDIRLIYPTSKHANCSPEVGALGEYWTGDSSQRREEDIPNELGQDQQTTTPCFHRSPGSETSSAIVLVDAGAVSWITRRGSEEEGLQSASKFKTS